MRLFVGIELPEVVRSGILSIGPALACGWEIPDRCLVRRENLHITVKFLGEVAEQGLAGLCARLKESIPAAPFALISDRIECLPERGPVRVVSAGLTGQADRLHELHASIESACEAIGVPRERRPFRPHITFARLRPPLPPIQRWPIESIRLPGEATRPFEVKGFVLFQSYLESGGARYVPLARFS